MVTVLQFRDVSLFENEEFGISKLNLSIHLRKKYHIFVENHDKLNTLLGLIEGRLNAQKGFIQKSGRLFTQSDRLLLGDKVYAKNAGDWLALKDNWFYFNNKRKSKYSVLDSIRAKHIQHLPIYKLNETEKIKFTLMSLMFQESGMILISRLQTLQLSEQLTEMLNRIIQGTHCTLCLFSIKSQQDRTYNSPEMYPSLTEVDLTSI